MGETDTPAEGLTGAFDRLRFTGWWYSEGSLLKGNEKFYSGWAGFPGERGSNFEVLWDVPAEWPLLHCFSSQSPSIFLAI